MTICAKNRRYLFWDEFDWRVGAACGRPRLSQIGTIVEKEIHRLSQIYSMVCVDKFVVMPNHIHLLIRIRFSESGRPQAAPTLSQIINQFKGSATKRAGYILWQKGYHDHIIRSEADYLRIWDYIDTNPAKWQDTAKPRGRSHREARLLILSRTLAGGHTGPPLQRVRDLPPSVVLRATPSLSLLSLRDISP